jgi:glycosyltransferase involved in cell wall biosynthesis
MKPPMRFSIVIATYNRAALLRDTLASLSGLQIDTRWEVVVVDNNSPDDTRQVVDEAARSFPVRLQYVFEQEQGRSAALNAGFRVAEGDIIVTTDDDVRVEADWLKHIEFGLATKQCDYVGGRVVPLWESEPPRWIPRTNGRLWAVIALLDYGQEPIRLGARVPLGVNMAMRREAIERVGGFDTRIGRKAGTLLGQEVREWCMRATAAGLVGYYIPSMVVQHLIPHDRLNKRYFRRWFYWRGISRAMMYAQTGRDMEAPEQSQIDFSKVTHIAGVPRYLFRNAAVAMRDTIKAAVRRDDVNAFERELWLWMFAGIVAQRWKDRAQSPAVNATMHHTT